MTVAASELRARGAYFTPSSAADVLARWVLGADASFGERPARVLEPSMGDGAFLGALDAAADALAVARPEVWGVEVDAATFTATVSAGFLEPQRATLGDFLAHAPFPVDAVIGNPPYVRLRHLPAAQARRAASVAERVLGEPMETSGSVWMPFVLHACRFLRRGGRLALVLPYDVTYVRYARTLWRHLGRSFASLRVVRVRERMFPDVLQEVVLLQADGFGGATDVIELAAFESLTDVGLGLPAVTEQVSVARVVAGERAFLEALLPGEVRSLLAGALHACTSPMRDLIACNIGYVTGDKAFFHPGPVDVAEFALPQDRLHPALTSSRQLAGAGLRTSSIAPAALDRLYLPDDDELDAGEERYLAAGRAKGVHRRYKCRIREPWFVTPGVRRPELVVPVFTERPVMLINDASLVASNSLLCGFLRPGVHAESVVAGWYTSLTLLQLELHVHSLGGGVMVLIPGEAARLRLARAASADLGAIDAALLDGRIDDAFRSGDRPVLIGQLGLDADQCRAIASATATLAAWRTAVRR